MVENTWEPFCRSIDISVCALYLCQVSSVSTNGKNCKRTKNISDNLLKTKRWRRIEPTYHCCFGRLCLFFYFLHHLNVRRIPQDVMSWRWLGECDKLLDIVWVLSLLLCFGFPATKRCDARLMTGHVKFHLWTIDNTAQKNQERITTNLTTFQPKQYTQQKQPHKPHS